jgi:hypothetical protein
MVYNSYRQQKHSFEVVRNSQKSGAQVVKCPICGIHRWDSAMRIHIARMAKTDKAHKKYYEANTFEEIITRRIWKI